MYYAYLITNNVNNKVYVGITCNLKERWQRHQSNARSDSFKAKYRTYLYNAMRKHGIENFTFTQVARFERRNHCEAFEINRIAYMRKHDIPNYNLHDGGTLGYDMRTNSKYEIWKTKLSENAIGNSSNKKAKDAWKAKLAKARKGRTPALGMHHTDENKAIASKVSNKYWDTQDTYARDPKKVKAILALSHRKAKEQFGISTTHYYRLKKRFTVNDSK